MARASLVTPHPKKDHQATIMTTADFAGYLGQMGAGAWVTMKVFLLSFLLSLITGTLFGLGRLSRLRPLRAVLAAYASIAMGVPSLLIIFIIYYGGSAVLTALFGFDRGFDLSPFASGVVAITMVNAVYVGELIQSAVRNLPAGQFEACDALNIPRHKAWRQVLLPQVFRLALPGLVNVWIVILKETSLVSIVGLHDLISVAKTVGGATREPFLFLVASGSFYVAISVATVPLARRAERRLNRGYAGGAR